jgi:hypothetical protein
MVGELRPAGVSVLSPYHLLHRLASKFASRGDESHRELTTASDKSMI